MEQEVDLLSLFKDVALYNQQVLGAGHVRALVDAGCRAALSLGGVAHITCPVDLQEQSVTDDEPSPKKVEGHTSDARRRSRIRAGNRSRSSATVVSPCSWDEQVQCR
jgi:thiamine pyrophosphate-dependent acetolactate synthase large subunit-like protein